MDVLKLVIQVVWALALGYWAVWVLRNWCRGKPSAQSAQESLADADSQARRLPERDERVRGDFHGPSCAVEQLRGLLTACPMGRCIAPARICHPRALVRSNSVASGVA